MTRICSTIQYGLWLLLIVFLAGCGGNPPMSQQTAHYVVKLSFDRLVVGDRTATVEITDQAGQPVSVNKVVLVPTMLSMGMASPEVSAQRDANGRYIAEKVLLSMTGDWEIDITIQTSSTNETARFTFTIPTQ